MSRLPPDIRMETMQSLMQEVLTIQKQGVQNEETMIRVREIIEESGRVVEQSDKPPEMVIDSNVLATSINLVRSHVHALNTDLMTFSPEEYTNGIVSFINDASKDDWDLLAVETCTLFRKVTVPTFMLGTIQLDPPPPPERAERQRKTFVEAKKNQIQAVEKNPESAEPTDEVYKHIMKCLVDQFRKSGKTPVNFLQFVVDPDSYWRTVENIFHFSFLVRDAKVKMSLNENAIPVVEPLVNKNSENPPSRKNSQFLFRLTQSEWREICTTFKVKKPMIVPLKI